MNNSNNTAQNYPKKLLQSATTSLFITIPQTTIEYSDLHIAIRDFKHTNYVITKLEQHENEGLHIHIVAKFKQTIRITAIHNIIFSMTGVIGGTVDYQKPKCIQATINYLKKEESSIDDAPFLEDGDIPKNNGKYSENNIQILEAIQKAQDGKLDEALEDIKQIDPMKYIQYKEQIKGNLSTENKTKKKYALPSFKTQDVKLSIKQQQVWDLLQQSPKARRIIWVSGGYGSGKSFLFNYINSNHEYGMYNAGSSASMDNVVYGYDEEGIIAWDLPRTFDFDSLGNSISAVIEKFSDFGQSVSSKKYNGKTQYVRGHCIVFSNAPPLETLKHRDIIHINLSEQIEPTPIQYIPEIKPSESKREITLSDLGHSSSDEEEQIVQEDTIYPDIKKVKKGCLVKYIKRYRTSGGYVSSQTLNTLEEATRFMPIGCTSILL